MTIINKKEKILPIFFIFLILIIEYFIINFNSFRYPIFISRYATSSSIFNYLLENGHLPTEKLEAFDNYQPIIFISFLLSYFCKILNNSHFNIGILLFYSFPIIVFLLTSEITKLYMKKEKYKQKYFIPLFNSFIASFSSYILSLYNETLIFCIIFFLLYLYFKEGFIFSKKFYFVAFSGSIISTFYYNTGQLIYTIFIFLFYLFYLIQRDSKKKKSYLFLFLSCFNFLLIFFFYGILANVGFAQTLQYYVSNIFKIPSEIFFIALSIIIILFHYLLEIKFLALYIAIIKFIQKRIKIFIILFILMGITIISFIIINFNMFLENKAQYLDDFFFPVPYFNPITRLLNFLNLIILIIPFFLYGLSVIQKFILKLELNKIDLLYIISILLVSFFIPIFYIYGGLNYVYLRCSKMLSPFALLILGFFYLNPKSFFLYLKNPQIALAISNDKNKTSVNDNNQYLKENKRNYWQIILKIILIQVFFQIILWILVDQTDFIFFLLKMGIIYLNYYYFPGYIFLLLFIKQQLNTIEKYIWVVYINFCFLVVSLSLLNVFSIFFLSYILLMPFLIEVFILIIYFFYNLSKYFKKKKHFQFFKKLISTI